MQPIGAAYIQCARELCLYRISRTSRVSIGCYSNGVRQIPALLVALNVIPLSPSHESIVRLLVLFTCRVSKSRQYESHPITQHLFNAGRRESGGCNIVAMMRN